MSYYGLLLFVAVWSGIGVSFLFSRMLGVPWIKLKIPIIALLLGAYLGAKIGQIVIGRVSWSTVLDGFFSNAGHYHLGFVTGGLAFYVTLRLSHDAPRVSRAMDVLAPGLCIGQAIARIGCFQAGCCYGRRCSQPWAVTYTASQSSITGVPPDVPLHPVQLYDSVASLVVLLVILVVAASSRVRHGNGIYCATYCACYGAMRIGLEGMRGDNRSPLPTWMSAGMAALGLVWWRVIVRRAARTSGAAASPQSWSSRPRPVR